MIGFDAACRAVANVAFERDDNTRTVDSFGDLRSCDADYSAMPTFAGYHRHVRLLLRTAGAFQLCDGACDDLSLYQFALLISALKVLCQPLGFRCIPGSKQFDDCSCCIHSARGIYPRPNAKSEIVSTHATAI